jgi:hypothetical protein
VGDNRIEDTAACFMFCKNGKLFMLHKNVHVYVYVCVHVYVYVHLHVLVISKLGVGGFL